MKKALNLTFLLVILFSTIIAPFHHVNAQTDDSFDEAIIYYNEACAGCTDYLFESLNEIFEQRDIEAHYKDYVNEPDYRKELNNISKDLGIPFDLQSHIMVFVGNDLVTGASINYDNIRALLAGHIPTETTQFLLNPTNLETEERFVVYQDKMPNMEEVNDYKAWGFKGPIKTYDIDEPIETYINFYRENQESFDSDTNLAQDSWKWKSLLPTIAVTGLFDGLNPCAIAILLLFISYLFTIRKTRQGIVKMGIIYIAAVYLAYLLIGLGLMKAVLVTGVPHFMAWVGSIAVIALGTLNLINYFVPQFPIKIRVPDFTKGAISEYMYKATMPAAFILGFVVGLCTFPCSGGPYVAIITMLSNEVTWFRGLFYLLIYNLMFVMPLVAILILSGNKKSVEKIERWESSNSKYLHLISGLLMVGLGLIIILFFI